MIVQLEYINHLLQVFKNYSYYASIMLSVTYYAQNYASIIGWYLLCTIIGRIQETNCEGINSNIIAVINRDVQS